MFAELKHIPRRALQANYANKTKACLHQIWVYCLLHASIKNVDFTSNFTYSELRSYTCLVQYVQYAVMSCR